jgi:prepilin-type N-terminal cleavage/methylation domain-containing protein
MQIKHLPRAKSAGNTTIASLRLATTDPPCGASRGFTLTELAVVLAIVGLLLGTLMYTLSAQTEVRAISDNQRRLEEAKEFLLNFAVVNRRLPCPAAAPPYLPFNNVGSTGIESPAGGTCTDGYTGFLPGRALGFQPVDDAGYALDAWGNPIRYAVSTSFANRYTTQHTLASPWDLTATPNDLIVCGGWGGSTTDCGTAKQVTAGSIVVAVIWSQGKNFRPRAASGVAAGGGVSPDEIANNKHRLPSLQNGHPVFVWRAPAPSDTPTNEYDDYVVWIPVTLVYGRMIAAGVLP